MNFSDFHKQTNHSQHQIRSNPFVHIHYITLIDVSNCFLLSFFPPSFRRRSSPTMPSRQNRLVGGFLTCLVTGVAYLATKGRDLFSEGPVPSSSQSVSPISPLISAAVSTCAAAVTAVTSSPSPCSAVIASSTATAAATAVTTEAAKQASVLASNLLSPSQTRSILLSRGQNPAQFLLHTILLVVEESSKVLLSNESARATINAAVLIARNFIAAKAEESALYLITNASSFASGLLSFAFMCMITIAAAPCVFVLIAWLATAVLFSRSDEVVEEGPRWSRLPRSKLRTFRVARFEEMGRLRRQNGALRGALRAGVGYMKGAVKAYRSVSRARLFLFFRLINFSELFFFK